MAGLALSDIIMKRPLHLVNEGPLAELYAGQQLIAGSHPNMPPDLYYRHREARARNAEVDYVISSGNTIFGIEVKAATSGRMQSLRRFLEEAPRRRGIRVSHENCAVLNDIRIVPLYAAELLSQE
jgi:predicted AAA+ superfamily ATPase